MLLPADRGQLLQMKVNLFDLLRQREIVHPTRITAIEAGNRQLRVTVFGYPWWQSVISSNEGRIAFLFEGIKEGLLDADTLLDMEEDEALEVFRVSPLSNEQWATVGKSYAIYCSSPLPEPLKLYALVEDYLWNIHAPRSARDYLNVPNGSLTRFGEITKSSSFLVAKAPERLHQIISAELQRQNVRHNVLTSTRPATHNLFVEMGSASFTCERATAEM